MTTMPNDDDDWQPGDPLYSRDHHPHSLYVFNFRVDTVSEECHCLDAASWPDPAAGRAIVPGDELGELIAWHRCPEGDGRS